MEPVTGQHLVDLASTKKGDKYVFGSLAPKDQAAYAGPFDCAELMSWTVYQALQKLFGCENDNSTHPGTADAGTVYWGRDCADNVVKVISIEEASVTPGAILLRENEHIVMVVGPNETIEAMGAAWGVCNGKINGRRWTQGILIPGVNYTPTTQTPEPYTQPMVLRIGIANNPDDVKYIQNQLTKLGFYHIAVDGQYGPATFAAVKNYQISKGLVPDGEVGPQTLKSLSL